MIAFSEVALIAALGLMLPINHNRVAAFQRWLRRWPISRQAVNERFALSNRLERTFVRRNSRIPIEQSAKSALMSVCY